VTRGRPREFDEDKVLDAAMRVFWAKGYAATSIDDILQATGLSKPSLYAAFGGKAKLYRTVLGRFVGAIASAEIAALADPAQPPGKALAASLKKTGQRLLRDDTPHGCMVAGSILDQAGLDSGTHDDVLATVGAMEAAFLARTGNRASARLAVAAIVGMGALARIQRDPEFHHDITTALSTAIAPTPKALKDS
jgi:AcrR family transcriptional regulator